MSAENDYGQRTRRMLCILRERGLLVPDAFAAYVQAATGANLTAPQVYQYIRGTAHFPAELLPHLVAFVGEDHAALVLSPLLAGSGWGLIRENDVTPFVARAK